MAAVNKALQSGDIASAQSAFAKLQQDMQALRGAHHHHHHGHGAKPANDPTTTTPASSTSLDVTA